MACNERPTLVVVACVFAFSLPTPARVIRVSNAAPADANTIQAGIDAATDGDTVLVAPGTYTGAGNRDIDFKGKAIAVKSEAGPETCVIDCNGTEQDRHRGFLFRSGEATDSVLQGISIRNGYADKGGGAFCDSSRPTILNCIITHCTAYTERGGGLGAGIYCYDSNAVVQDCVLADNVAEPDHSLGGLGGYGGGIYCAKGAATITDCLIKNNREGWGGAVHCLEASSRIHGCTILNNATSGIYCGTSTARIDGCSMIDNAYGIICERNDAAIVENCLICGHKPCGVRCLLSSPTIRRCVIAGNGIGVSLYDSEDLTIDNCTITANALEGLDFSGHRCTISNSIFWNNQSPHQIEMADEDYGLAAQTSVCRISYSNVQGGEKAIYAGDTGVLEWGPGNIGADPCFADPGHWERDPNSPSTRDGGPWFVWVNGDFHLKFQAGRWDPNGQKWVLDGVTSPCIDAGDPNSPVGDEPDPNGGRINMGAYGGTKEASKSACNLGLVSLHYSVGREYGIDPTERWFTGRSR